LSEHALHFLPGGEPRVGLQDESGVHLHQAAVGPAQELDELCCIVTALFPIRDSPFAIPSAPLSRSWTTGSSAEYVSVFMKWPTRPRLGGSQGPQNERGRSQKTGPFTRTNNQLSTHNRAPAADLCASCASHPEAEAGNAKPSAAAASCGEQVSCRRHSSPEASAAKRRLPNSPRSDGRPLRRKPSGRAR
jgi:hypothetical protein